MTATAKIVHIGGRIASPKTIEIKVSVCNRIGTELGLRLGIPREIIALIPEERRWVKVSHLGSRRLMVEFVPATARGAMVRVDSSAPGPLVWFSARKGSFNVGTKRVAARGYAASFDGVSRIVLEEDLSTDIFAGLEAPAVERENTSEGVKPISEDSFARCVAYVNRVLREGAGRFALAQTPDRKAFMPMKLDEDGQWATIRPTIEK